MTGVAPLEPKRQRNIAEPEARVIAVHNGPLHLVERRGFEITGTTPLGRWLFQAALRGDVHFFLSWWRVVPKARPSAPPECWLDSFLASEH